MRLFQQRNYVELYGAVLIGLMVSTHLLAGGPGEYLYRLAQAFAAGRLHVETFSPDLSLFNGRYYYPDGPLPAVLLIPFAAAGWHVKYGVFTLAINIGVFYLCFLLARHYGYSESDSCWFAIAFTFGTSFVNSSLVPWGYTHAIVVLCLFYAILEYEGKRRPALIGLSIGLAMTTRASAGLNIIFFALTGATETRGFSRKLSSMAQLLSPFGAIVFLLALYNYLRFENPLESGYTYQLNALSIPFNEWNSAGNTAGPTLSITNIPTNLKVFLFGLPEPTAMGSSVFLLSPFLIYLQQVKLDPRNKLIALNCAVVLLFVLSFRSTGFAQVGYRFSLDFLPFAFWMLLRSQVKMTQTFKALIFVATVIDLALVVYFFATGTSRHSLSVAS